MSWFAYFAFGHEVPSGGKFKADVLADAGISTSTAHRYEEIAGGRERQGGCGIAQPKVDRVMRHMESPS